MALKRCPQGHYYDPEQHSSCPSCGVADLNFSDHKTRGKKTPPAPDPAEEASAEQARQERGGTQRVSQPRSKERAPGVTVGLVRKQTGTDPVVGWLVCVEGPERGRDHRIRSERNFIGRAPNMDICIGGDETISREKHAIVSFNPRNNQFTLAPGEGRGITYLNNEEVMAATLLKSHDLIELGETKLLFVPLCGEHFQWS